MKKYYNMEAVKKSKYTIIDNKVYNLQSFYDHPGGIDILKEFEGKDATDIFMKIGHTDRAKKMMKEFYIGELKK